MVFRYNQEHVHQVKSELFSKKIYIYIAKDDIIKLPKGATIIDSVYKSYSGLGNTTVLTVLNDKVVIAEHEIKTKDRIATDVL